MLSKIDKATFNAFLKERKNIMTLEGHDGVGVSFEVRLKSVKKNEDLTFRIDPNADLSAQVIKQVMDPSNSHPYRQKKILLLLLIKRLEITLLTNIVSEQSDIMKTLKNFRNIITFISNLEVKRIHKKAVNLFLKNIKEQPNYIEIAIKEFKKSNPRS